MGKCEKCKEIIYKEDLRKNSSICPNCGHYFRVHIGKRIEMIADEGTYQRFWLKYRHKQPIKDLEDYPKTKRLGEISYTFRRSSIGWKM